jgi:ABC-2 type transport system ATP-binding protein
VVLSSHMLDDVRRLADTIGILYAGQLLVQGSLDELLRTTKRICATIGNGQRPQRVPEGTIWQQGQGRQWIATVRDFTPEKVQQFRALAGVEHVEVLDMGLEELFKDFVKGQKVTQ